MRICKVVKRHDTSVPNAYKYQRWIYRVVECEPEQHGWLSERGVVLVWQSEFLTYQGGPKDRAQKTEAERICALGNRAIAVGLVPKTPEGIIGDREQEILT